MLTAQQASSLRQAMKKHFVDAILFKILRDIADRAIDPTDKNYVYADLDYVDDKADLVVKSLRDLGYTVVFEKYPEDGYSSLTVSF